MPEFALMLRDEPDGFRNLAPADMQAAVKRYMDWFDRLRVTGKLKGSHKLTDRGGRVMRGRQPGTTVTDGPYTEGKEVLGGLFVIEAPGYEDAVKIASDCPHLEFGTIEVREIEVLRRE
jgi:hypothetical protein